MRVEGARGPRTIYEERQLFEEALDGFLADGKEGKYVLFKDGEAVGFYTTENEAHEAGLDRFGLQAYIIDLVMQQRSSWVPPSMRF